MSTSGVNPLRILHISDTHLFGDGSLHYGMVDTFAALGRVLDRAAPFESVDVVVASGDLSEDGSEESYRLLRGAIEPWAASRNAAVVYAMGNHDDRTAFENVLGVRDGVSVVRGFRLVHVDTAVPGAGHGELDQDQLDWLRDQLREPAENGTIVIAHHPPVRADTALLAALQLRKPADLLASCTGGDVRVILSGHYHHALATSADGIPVIVAPGIANTTDALALAGHERATIGAGFALVDVPVSGPVRAVFIAAPGPEDGLEIFDLDNLEVRHIVATMDSSA